MGTRTETIETSTESDCVQWDMKCERVLDICPFLCYLMGSYDAVIFPIRLVCQRIFRRICMISLPLLNSIKTTYDLRHVVVEVLRK